MPGKPSIRTQQAMELVREGITPYAAARKMKIHISTIYRSVLYKKWQKEIDAANQPRRAQKPDPRTVEAIELVKLGIKPGTAARTAGIHRVTLYQSALYRKG